MSNPALTLGAEPPCPDDPDPIRFPKLWLRFKPMMLKLSTRRRRIKITALTYNNHLVFDNRDFATAERWRGILEARRASGILSD